MTIKSTTCFSKKTGKPLTVYLNQNDASGGADYANIAYGNKLSPYQCNHCEMWHLSPKDRQTPSVKCPDCTDSNGYYKNLYKTAESALNRASILSKEQGIDLRVYECPCNEGWHLTKRY